jgi:translocation and assembly module TamB
VRLDQHLAINASVQRQSGDFYLSERETHRVRSSAAGANSSAPAQSAGLRDVYLRVTGNDQQLRLQALWDSAHAGRVQADISSGLQRQGGAWVWPENSPIKGSINADLPTLGLWSALAPTGWRVGGNMALDAAISGSRIAPDLRGQLKVQDLSMRSVLDGVELKNGQLLARFAGTRMDVERFYIEGAEGQLNAAGRLAWEAGQPSMDIRLNAERLRASNRPDRRVTISGSVQAGLQGKRITLKGKLGIDEALILLADSSKPSLGDDVRIVRKQQTEQNATTVPSEAQLAAEEAASKAAAQAALAPFTPTKNEPAWALDAAVQLDMGKDMRVRGMGLDTRLGGVLTIQTVSEQSTSKGQMALRPEIVGTLNTIGGEYRAYGQWLEIEEGIIRFTGPYNDPRLDILAIRPRTEERVGVRITGPASNPRVALYAENAMPDSEKLAWLILGREGSNGGAEAAMLQQAAVALLGSGSNSSGLAQSIGLDELGYRSAETNSDGTVRESSISIGKRLSRRLYMSYERSLSGALGTLFVFYDISRRFTLRAQSNEKASALDVIFTRRYQSLLPAKRAALNAAAERERQAEIAADAARKAGTEKSVPNTP